MTSYGKKRLPLLTRRLAMMGATFFFLIVRPVAGERAPRKVRQLTAQGNNQPLLTAERWKSLDRAVDRGLAFLSKNQEADGSFPTAANAQPAVTSLCVMAFLSRGHLPGKGPYGVQMDRAIDYVLAMQDDSSGAIVPNRFVGSNTYSSNYCHGISGVMLAEVYGTTDSRRHERIRTAITRALAYTRQQQRIPKRPQEQGGWRYVNRQQSDLSVTSWQLMFYRAARNAEFEVPEEWVKGAMDYVHRLFDVNQRCFVYGIGDSHQQYCTRGMAGAGIVCLALGGEHRSETAKMAGDWILQNSFEPYNNSRHDEDRYHYGAFYCSQAMFQLGGDYWNRFFPPLLRILSESQHADGSWDAESIEEDRVFGNNYTTSLAVLALSAPYQILPIYQR